MSKKSKSCAFPLFIIFFVCGGIAALIFSGQLPHIISKIKGTQEAPDQSAEMPATLEKEDKQVAEQPMAPATEETVVPVVKEPTAPVVKKTAKQDTSVAEESGKNEIEAKYRARFKAPKPGQKMKIYLKGIEKPRIAILTQLDDKNIVIKTETYDMTITRDQLAPITRAQCYEDDYVKYMIARDARAKSIEKLRAEQLAVKKKQYMAFMAKKGKAPSKAPAAPSSKTEKRSSNSSDISSDGASFFGIGFEEWLKQEGGTGSNKAR